MSNLGNGFHPRVIPRVSIELPTEFGDNHFPVSNRYGMFQIATGLHTPTLPTSPIEWRMDTLKGNDEVVACDKAESGALSSTDLAVGSIPTR